MPTNPVLEGEHMLSGDERNEVERELIPDHGMAALTEYALAAITSDAEALEPRTLKEARERPDWPLWEKAIEEELETLRIAGTWVLEEAPPDANIVGSKWVFKAKKEELGIERARKDVNVCRASFYKYINGENVPDMDVLRAAKEKWGTKWKHLDPSEVLRPMKVKTAKQLVFSFLSEIEEDDIEIVQVAPEGASVLQVVLKIRFPTYK